MPEREGVLILDATSFPKQGTHSVGVARQYCGTLGKVANCQVAVTAALWTGARAWMLGAALYLPDTWLTVEARQRAKIPVAVRFQEKWRLALTLCGRSAPQASASPPYWAMPILATMHAAPISCSAGISSIP